MKKLLFLVLLLSNFFGFAQYTLIPDVNFEKVLIRDGFDNGIIDGKVLTASISGIINLNVSNYQIQDLKGLQDFVSLEILDCSWNGLTSIDVSKNTSLKEFNCNNNNLSILDVSKNSILVKLQCYQNKLINLDISNNLFLTYLICSLNKITNLDVTKNVFLNRLECGQNQLANLNLINNINLTQLICYENNLTNLDLSQNILLTDLWCLTNKLNSLDLSKNNKLKNIWCENNQLTSLNISNSNDLQLLHCFNNKLTNLDISHINSLSVLLCNNNQLTSLNLKNGNNTNLIAIDLTRNPYLICIQVDNINNANTRWPFSKDATASYSENCSRTTATIAPPVITATGNQIYCAGTSLNIVETVNITFDPAEPTIDAVYIQISSGYLSGQDQLKLNNAVLHPTIRANSFDPTTGILKLVSQTGSSIPYSDFEKAIKDVQFSNSSTSPSGIRTFSISLGSGQLSYLPRNKHFYEYVANTGITWTNAKTAAALKNYYGLQGYLATLTAADEAQLAGAQAPGTGWIGGSDAETEGVWKWVTGPENGTIFWNGGANGSSPPNQFALWNTGEPNNSNNNEHYAHVKAPSVPGITGSWNDLQLNGDSTGNYQAKGYIVEYGGMRSGDVDNIEITASTTITIPRIESTAPNSTCVSGNVTLQAIASNGNINWYTTKTGGTLVATGNSYTTPTIYATTSYYVDATNGNCPNVPRTEIIAGIKTPPTITSTSPATICDVGTATLAATASAGNVQWYDSAGNFLVSGNSFTTPIISSTTTYFVDATANDCTTTARTAIIATVNRTPSVTSTTPSSRCDTGTVSLEATASAGNINWYDDAGNFLVTGNTFTTPILDKSTTYYVAAINSLCTSVKTSITATVYPIDKTNEEVLLCQGETTTLDASIPGMNYLWSPGGETTQIIVISSIGEYSVTISSPTVASCDSQKNFTVIEHPEPIISSISVNENSITIELANSESYYEYSIDDEYFQSSNQFSYIPSGKYTAFVRDNNGCNLVAQDFTIFTIAKYFTPNNDGFHDIWEIKEMEDYPNSTAQIFDRYGKLIINLNINKHSWDGKFNNKVLPADDYWYRLKLDKTKPEVTGHFTLKR